MTNDDNPSRKRLAWIETDEDGSSAAQEPKVAVGRERTYAPLTDTFRLYAGWLLGWYFVLFAVGGYQRTRSLPFSVPFVDELLLSPVVVTVSFAVFLFLLATSLHRSTGRHAAHGLLFGLVGAIILAVFVMNV
ncbi:MAG: hypothetical protein PHW10_04210 [Candidatus Peribacteraceae bacterium]|nr:hypothetical protein [Candidatus Peribacteraceae bacterium]